jgi:6-phosphogluconolactonase
VYFADERVVPLDHADSNYKAVMETCLNQLGVPAAKVHAIDPSLSPEAAAVAYEKMLVEEMGPEPAFDLVLLGMGPDGHTCSLFPGHPLLHEESRLVASITDSPKPPPGRITLTYKALRLAKAAAFVTAGDAKAAMLASIVHDPKCDLPSARVTTQDGKPLWFVDRGAASLLHKA